MATPNQRPADSLSRLHKLQSAGRVAVRAGDISRTHRARLSGAGYLTAVMKGWYVAARPGDDPGETTPWFTSCWRFVAQYLRERFDDDWCVGAEDSILLLVGDETIPTTLNIPKPRQHRSGCAAHQANSSGHFDFPRLSMTIHTTATSRSMGRTKRGLTTAR